MPDWLTKFIEQLSADEKPDLRELEQRRKGDILAHEFWDPGKHDYVYDDLDNVGGTREDGAMHQRYKKLYGGEPRVDLAEEAMRRFSRGKF